MQYLLIAAASGVLVYYGLVAFSKFARANGMVDDENHFQPEQFRLWLKQRLGG